MDEIDRKIISELMDDARKPFRKIAKKIGVSTPTVTKRYRELKKRGIIQRCSIQIDLAKIGYKGTAHLLITTSGGNGCPRGSEAMVQLQKFSDVIIASKAMGDFEGYAVLVFKDIEDLYEKLLKIKSLSCVSKLEISLGIPGMQIFPLKRNPFNHASK
jgi:Lrp/AsnC family transcriptional regulator for asnA, asnC and gidA